MIKNKLLADDVRHRAPHRSSLEYLVHFEALTTHLRNELLQAIRERANPHGRRV